MDLGTSNEGIPCVLQNSSITEASVTECLESYAGHSLEVSNPSAEVLSFYSAALDQVPVRVLSMG